MYPAAFEYHAPTSVKEALGLLGKHKDDAKLLAGGHSLIPMMKLRLAQPKHLIDLRKVPGLTGIKQDGNMLAIGAMTTHWEVESSALVKAKLAVLSEVAALIGDPAVRNRGTVGGSLAHADPAADYPAAVIALGAEMVCEGARARRRRSVSRAPAPRRCAPRASRRDATARSWMRPRSRQPPKRRPRESTCRRIFRGRSSTSLTSAASSPSALSPRPSSGPAGSRRGSGG